jgi:hypothetical protein
MGRDATEEARLKAEIAEAGRCSADADCEVVTGACPLGCWMAVNKSEAPRIQAMLDDYGARSTCVYSCIAHEGARCVSGSCEVKVPQP